MQIKFSKKYKVLFEILQGKHPEVDTVIITGGRGSAKSFVISVFSLIALVQHKWNVFIQGLQTFLLSIHCVLGQ